MNLYLQDHFDLVLVATQALFSHGSALSLSHEQHGSRLNILGKIMYTCTTWSVRKIQPPNFDNFRGCWISPAVFADLWSNRIMPGWMRTSASLYFWWGFIHYVLIFWFVVFFFPFSISFPLQIPRQLLVCKDSSCFIPGISTQLPDRQTLGFLQETQLSFFPDLLLFSLGWS